MKHSTSPIPSSRTPQTGFDQPFEMLVACHEHVERMLRLMHHMRLHLAAMGCDDQARQAARDVMRYFDGAAPAHHEDEERHVFPPLLAAGICVDTVQRLQREHREMTNLWPAVRAALQDVADADRNGFEPGEEALLERFARLYDWHIAAENELVYPAAAKHLDTPAQAAMSQEMAHRRGLR